jgi:hypothetical protein
MIEKILNLRFLSEGPKQVSVVVQGDELRRLTCNLVDIEIAATATVQAYMYKPSGLVATCYGSVISTTQIQIDLTAQMLAENGTSRFQVKILEDGDAITSYEIPFVVRRDLALEAVESEADLTALETIIERLVVGHIATAYDSTESYSVGDIVSYDGKVYQCTTATTGTWDENDWQETSAVEVLENIVSDVGDISELNTTSKNNLVAAINETYALASTTDTTLTIAGMAADAKAAGDAIDDLKEDLQEETTARVTLGNELTSLGLVVSNGQLCVKYAE